jgi:membrane-associated protease RseP (regulator of RpoE activity)
MQNPERNVSEDYNYPPLSSPEPPPTSWTARVLRTDRPRLNVVLFILTCLSTFFIGYTLNNSVASGLWYCGGIISILLAHEMGHYLMCLRYHIPATLPYFIPFPSLPFGTMGAVIRMDARMPNRRVLFDIGVAGPLAGLVLTIPAIYFGLKMSTVVQITGTEGVWTLGDSLLFRWLSRITIGELPPGYDTLLHPLAYAGWAGLFVTALNLLPIGQLDGGHILYALVGERGRKIYSVNMALFALLGIVKFSGWYLLIVLLLWFGYRHPPTQENDEPLDRRRQALAYLTFLIFVLSFTPVPFQI